MVLLVSNIFLLLTQVLLWIVVGMTTWFVLVKALPRAFLSLLVLGLILLVLAVAFVNGAPTDGGVLESLWRIISFPLSPFGLGLVLLSVLFSGGKISKVGKNVINVVLILLALSSTPIISYALAQNIERGSVEMMKADPQLTSGRRVIVLLGRDSTRAQLRPRQDPVPANPPKVDAPIPADSYQVMSALPVQLTESGDRIFYTAQLFGDAARLGKNPLVVVSAPKRSDRRQKDGERKEDISEARDIQRMLSGMGVPAESIYMDHDGTDIYRSAENVRKLLADNKIDYGNQLMVVSSALDMNRAALSFRQVFPETDVIARPTNFYALPPADDLRKQVAGRDLVEREVQIHDILPNAESLKISTDVIEEYLKSIYYFLRGWIKPLQAPR